MPCDDCSREENCPPCPYEGEGPEGIRRHENGAPCKTNECERYHVFDEPDAPIHKWRKCESCGHPQHSSQCREMTMPGPPGDVDECGCIDLTSIVSIIETCRRAGGCPKHPLIKDPPPSTEEEEEAPEDEGCISKMGCAHLLTKDYERGCRMAADELAREAQDKPAAPPPDPGEEEGPPPCAACGSTADSWFDRGVCPEPCGSAHNRCSDCGAAVDACPIEDGEPYAPPPAGRDGLWKVIEKVIYELRERTMQWGETDGMTQAIADAARRAVGEYGGAPQTGGRRPPYAVAYAVEGQEPFEVLVPGNTIVRVADGRLVIEHDAAAVTALLQIRPWGEEQ